MSNDEQFGGYYDGGEAITEKPAEGEAGAIGDKGAEGIKPADELLYPDDKAKAAEEGKKATEEAQAKEKAEKEAVAKEAEETKAKEAEAKKTEEAKKTDGVVKAEDLKFPEDAKVDETIQTKFLEAVNNKDLKPAELAQTIIELQQELYTAQQDAHADQVKQWETEVKEDKDLGGDKLDENLAIAKKALDMLEIEGLKELLDATGLGSNIVFARMFHKIGSVISEDSFVKGGKIQKDKEKSDAQIMYPSMK